MKPTICSNTFSYTWFPHTFVDGKSLKEVFDDATFYASEKPEDE